MTFVTLPDSGRPSDCDAIAFGHRQLAASGTPGLLWNVALTSTSIFGIVYEPAAVTRVVDTRREMAERVHRTVRRHLAAGRESARLFRQLRPDLAVVGHPLPGAAARLQLQAVADRAFRLMSMPL